MQNVSLPEELQKILDQKIGMGMVGTTWASSCSTRPAQSIPTLAAGAGGGEGGGIVGSAVGLGAGVALGQVMANQLGQGLQRRGAGRAGRRGRRGRRAGVKPEDVMATLERLGEMKTKGILTAGRVRRQEGRAAEEARLM